jgi:hypothetical protein
MSELFAMFPHESGIALQRGIEIGIIFSSLLISHCFYILHSRKSRDSIHPLMDLSFEILLLARLVSSIPRPYWWIHSRKRLIAAQMERTPQMIASALYRIHGSPSVYERFLLYFYYGWLTITGGLAMLTPYRTPFGLAVWRHILLNIGCIVVHRIICVILFYYLINADLPRGLHPSVIASETVLIHFGVSPSPPKLSTDCSICYIEYSKSEKVRILPCGHDYHMVCIDEWLTRHRNRCPMCMHIVGS